MVSKRTQLMPDCLEDWLLAYDDECQDSETPARSMLPDDLENLRDVFGYLELDTSSDILVGTLVRLLYQGFFNGWTLVEMSKCGAGAEHGRAEIIECDFPYEGQFRITTTRNDQVTYEGGLADICDVEVGRNWLSFSNGCAMNLIGYRIEMSS